MVVDVFFGVRESLCMDSGEKVSENSEKMAQADQQIANAPYVWVGSRNNTWPLRGVWQFPTWRK
jgi:hypothetical protein